ncbi:MAG: thiamine phosphate synthase [Alphaproteobacteria bacterium]|nr:thiamine phosphate synthase [Alphaproteobacteria bacterium]
MLNPGCRLYLITPPRLDPAAFSPLMSEALDGGDVGCFQLRLKGVEDDAIRQAVEALMPLAHAREVAFILNDRPDLAAEMDCDGVHIGREDGDYRSARAMVGADQIVGVTCHNSLHLAMSDAETGADYVAFGAFFPTGTKDAQHKAEIETLEAWAESVEVPCVAIGGITPANCAPLVQAGADFLAVVSAVWDAEDGPAAGVKAMNEAIRDAF